MGRDGNGGREVEHRGMTGLSVEGRNVGRADSCSQWVGRVSQRMKDPFQVMVTAGLANLRRAFPPDVFLVDSAG